MSSCRHAVLPFCRSAVALLLLAACQDLNVPGGVTLSNLIMLPLSNGAPAPAGLSFYVSNARTTTRNLIHSDGFNTLFATISFPAGSLASLDGAPLGAGDSVQVTLTADAAVYGIHLAPDGLAFTSQAQPVLTFSYARYGDLNAASGSQYPDPAAYAAALAVWHEGALGLWSNVGNGGSPGTDVEGNLPQGGHYVAAAPR
jgi:hypothetical protein